MAVSSPDIVAVIPAAGIGSRMQAECPKQYLTIGGKTLLEHAVNRVLNHPRVIKVIIALHPEDRRFEKLELTRLSRVSTVTGGGERAASVLAGLHAAGEAPWILVHDAARPCLHARDLERLIALTHTSRVGGILAAPVRDTMKRSEPGVSAIAYTVEREHLWHALTPQLFPLPLLRECLIRALDEGITITDEASALEFCGFHPEIVSARADNIKVTRPEDLALAAFYLSRTADMENE